MADDIDRLIVEAEKAELRAEIAVAREEGAASEPDITDTELIQLAHVVAGAKEPTQ